VDNPKVYSPDLSDIKLTERVKRERSRKELQEYAYTVVFFYPG